MSEVDEKNEFTKLMEDAGVKHQVRLASGTRGRGLFPTGVVGWNSSDVLLSVPLDICIAAPFGDEGAIKAEFSDGSKDTLLILRRAWEARNKVKIPMAITNLLESSSADDRELAIALWVAGSLAHSFVHSFILHSNDFFIPTTLMKRRCITVIRVELYYSITHVIYTITHVIYTITHVLYTITHVLYTITHVIYTITHVLYTLQSSYVIAGERLETCDDG